MQFTHTSLRAEKSGQQTKMAKVAVSVVVVSFIIGLYFSPCLAMMTGGISLMNEKIIPDVVKEGVGLYLKNIAQHHSAFDYKAVNCEKMKLSLQMVQGMLYRTALEIVPVEEGTIHSDCIKGSDSFRLGKGDVKFVCLEIWSRPWLESSKSLIVKEVDEPHKRNDVESCLEVNS